MYTVYHVPCAIGGWRALNSIQAHICMAFNIQQRFQNCSYWNSSIIKTIKWLQQQTKPCTFECIQCAYHIFSYLIKTFDSIYRMYDLPTRLVCVFMFPMILFHFPSRFILFVFLLVPFWFCTLQYAIVSHFMRFFSLSSFISIAYLCFHARYLRDLCVAYCFLTHTYSHIQW